MNKKQWQKPELIVLVRSKPEEAVLLVCKGGPQANSDLVRFNWCMQQDACTSGCDAIAAT
jgi:hypothetical protein